MQLQAIEIACDGAGWLSIDEMIEIQGELKSLSKENYQRLKTEILETGYAFPIRIWCHEGKHKVVGGTQTRRTLLQMRAEGYSIPRLPVSFVKAKDEAEAMRRVLQDAAQYGQIERQGLYEFMHKANMDFEIVEQKFDLPNLDLETFKLEFFKSPEPQSETLDNKPVNLEEQLILTVFCKTETELSGLYDEMSKRGLECKIIT